MAAVPIFYSRVLADDLTRPFFEKLDMETQTKKQVAFMTWAFGGPEDYKGRDLRSAHASLVQRGLNGRSLRRRCTTSQGNARGAWRRARACHRSRGDASRHATQPSVREVAMVFDRVVTKSATGQRTMAADEFTALPLTQRVRLLLQGNLQFFRNDQLVNTATALAGIRKEAVERDEPSR